MASTTRKIWRQLIREGESVARCTVERLMAAPCSLDKVNRQFVVDHPNALWASDFTYDVTWQGFVYVAFIIDAFARRIVGWRKDKWGVS